MKPINVEGGFSFCGGWNFSKLVSVDSTFIREMRVAINPSILQLESSPFGFKLLRYWVKHVVFTAKALT